MVYYYAAAGLGVLILVIVIVMMGSGSGRQETASRMGLIEKRLDDLEFRFGNLVQDTSADSDLAVQQQGFGFQRACPEPARDSPALP